MLSVPPQLVTECLDCCLPDGMHRVLMEESEEIEINEGGSLWEEDLVPVAGVDKGNEEANVHQVSHLVCHQLRLALEEEDLQQADSPGHPPHVVHHIGC